MDRVSGEWKNGEGDYYVAYIRREEKGKAADARLLSFF